MGVSQTVQETAANSMHVDVHHHGLVEGVANGKLEIVRAQSAKQHADFDTKPLHNSYISILFRVLRGVSLAGTGGFKGN